MLRFWLNKWYFDCTTADGAMAIGYAATLKYGPVRIKYGAILIKECNDGSLRQRQSFSFGRIKKHQDVIEWRSHALAVEGRWIGGAGSGEVVIYDGENGRIQWECLTFNAAVEMNCNGANLCGTGYVERIEMSAPPWHLPFSELRWGRFISLDRSRSAAWIDLRGGLEKSWLWSDGVLYDGSVSDDHVEIGGEKLMLESPQPVRRENVATTLLGHFRWAACLLPSQLRRISESKVLSAGRLESGNTEAQGWSIHEVVLWG